MAPIFILAHIQTADKESRDEILATVGHAAQLVERHEPDVSKYALNIPADSSDERTIWVIEEYADQAAFDLHCAKTYIKYVFSAFELNPHWFLEPPSVYTTTPIHSISRQPALGLTKSPYIVVESLGYKDEHSFEEGKKQWSKIASTAQSSGSKTLAFAVCTNDPNKLFVVGVYDSEEDWRIGHDGGEAVRHETEMAREHLVSEPQVVKLRRAGGFWGRTESSLFKTSRI